MLVFKGWSAEQHPQKSERESSLLPPQLQHSPGDTAEYIGRLGRATIDATLRNGRRIEKKK